MGDRINLRCPECGAMRRPVISPLLPDHVVVFCDPCYLASLSAEDFGPGWPAPPSPARSPRIVAVSTGDGLPDPLSPG